MVYHFPPARPGTFRLPPETLGRQAQEPLRGSRYRREGVAQPCPS